MSGIQNLDAIGHKPKLPRPAGDSGVVGKFRLGLFGDTRSGKTMFLTALYNMSQEGRLPHGCNLRGKPGASLKHLNSRLAMVRSGQWPPGDVAVEPIELLLDYRNRAFCLRTQDFKGGDFGDLTEPEDKAKFNRFVDNLFAGCSAYIFLVDPAVLKVATVVPASSEAFREHRQALRVTTAVETALENLRLSGKASHWLHCPVAIVFTKSNVHPEVAEDPEGFAKQKMSPVCTYLTQYAPRRHRYFAASSTGCINAAQGIAPESPPNPLQPEGLVEPLQWCIDQHMNRHRLLKRLLCSVALILAASVYVWMYLDAGGEIRNIRELKSANDDRLTELFKEADRISHTIPQALTHPDDRIRIRQEVSAEARERFEKSIKQRIDKDGNLREVRDFEDLDGRMGAFNEGFPGTADAQDLSDWFKSQRNQLATRVANQLLDLAKGGKETQFDALLGQYPRVATPDADVIVEKAKMALNRNLGLVALKRLWTERVSSPGTIDPIRTLCTIAENDSHVQKLPPNSKERLYLQKVRDLYDGLKNTGTRRTLHFQILSTTGYQVRWKLLKADGDIDSGGWKTPAATNTGDGKYA